MIGSQFNSPPLSETTKSDLYSEKEILEEDYWVKDDFGSFDLVQESVEEEEYYDSENYISKPHLSIDSTLPINIIEFDHSYGYDCQKLFNLCVIDTNILIFASGNIIHFFDTSTGKKWYRRSFSGCGIGHITKNPKEPHVAVGEKGEDPLIIIYEWPSFEIVTILKRGTKTAYTFLNYSPDGELLCSQGGYPDFMLTIWNWKSHKIMLRSKAYGQNVFHSRFSLYVPGHLTSSGLSHIKFWKIEKTFTGMKLLGELGRFGKSEICNIIGFLALPDEKVVSGCEWGNILVWDAGLIRVEVFRRGKNYCHEAPITQFIYNNGDLTTVAMDGTIKVWYYETIELADPPEDEKFIEVEPIFEYEVGDYYHKAKLLVIVESDPDNPEDHTYFGQDGNGGLWKLDLSMSLNAQPSEQIFYCHSGKVAAIQCSPFSPHLASLGEDGRLFIYDYRQKKMITKKEFLAGGCSLLWLPLTIEESGCVLIGGFADGVIRVICISIHELRKLTSAEELINLIQVLKPHTKAISVLTIHPKYELLVTGSLDYTIFIFKITEGEQYPKLVPLGFVRVSGEVTHLTWKPSEEPIILVSCHNGTFMEIEIPLELNESDPSTYCLDNLKIRQRSFISIKSEIKRNLRISEIEEEKQALIEEKRLALITRAEETGIPIDEETILEALQDEIKFEEPELPEIFTPKIPNPILFSIYIGKIIWLSMGGYDAGYMYCYNFEQENPVYYKLIPEADDTEINCYQYYFNNKYLVLGLSNGQIRVVKTNLSDSTDMSNYWSLSMHDNDNGAVRQICFNYNYSYMFSCGNDGNVFAYKFFPELNEFKHVNVDSVVSKGFPQEICIDIDDIHALSLEEAKNKNEYENKMKEANTYKRDLMEVLKGLEKKFEILLRKNFKLPKSQQFPSNKLIVDARVVKDLEKFLEEEMQSVKFKIAWQLEKSKIQHSKIENYFLKPLETYLLKVQGIENKDIFVETFRLQKLGQDYLNLTSTITNKLEEQEAKGRGQAREFSEEKIVETITRRPNPVEALLKQIMVLCGDYKKNIKLRRLLRKYRERKDRLESRRIEWYEMMKKKPSADEPDHEDVAAIELAKDTIGDYQLKTASDYTVPKKARQSTIHVFQQLLQTRQKIYNIKKSYNDRVLALRKNKIDLIEKQQQQREVLLEIAKEIPKEKVRFPPNLPTYNEDVEFPEKKFQQNDLGILEELPKRFKSFYKAEVTKKKEIKFLDPEYEMLVLDKKVQKIGKVHSRLALMKFSGISGSRDIDELEKAGRDDLIITPWEKELKKLRVINRLFEQDKIIENMESEISNFDDEILALKEEKYQTEVDLNFLKLHLLTLYQELLILKKFEAAEEEKENKLFEKLREKHDIQKKMNEIHSKVEARNREIRRCEEEIKNIVTEFHAATAENKFYDFLKRIFKKKYRPPKIKSEDSDSDTESETSSSSEEEDAKSLDSKDIGPIRLDETVCPAGCDSKLYEWTFVQRSARHTLELNINEEKKQIDLHRKEYDTLMKTIKGVEVQYLACKEDLDEYIREKQRNLNEVETVVVLRLNQVQNFKSENEIEHITESVVFSASELSHLYKRVGELEKETHMEKQKHEKNRLHLTRMKIDVNHMKEMIVKLTKDIDEAMIRKFGMKVDIDDIEESLLKRLVAEMHSTVMDLNKSFDKKLEICKEQLKEKEKEYAKKMLDNTERYNLLTVLRQEKSRIIEALQRQTKAMCDGKIDDEHYISDIDNLRKVAKMQEGKICELRSEIAALKLKAKAKPLASEKVQPEVIQKIPIKECDGEYEETIENVKEELKDMCEEAQEIAIDAKEGRAGKEDMNRMKQLTGEMIEKFPEKFRNGILKQLLKSLGKEENLPTRCVQDIIFEEMNTLEMDSFLEIVQIIKENLDLIMEQ